jgi:hypothetical protein
MLQLLNRLPLAANFIFQSGKYKLKQGTIFPIRSVKIQMQKYFSEIIETDKLI